MYLYLIFVVSVMLYYCILCVALLMDLFVLCVACLTLFHQTIRNNYFVIIMEVLS